MAGTGGNQRLGGMAFRKAARQSSKQMLEFQKTLISDHRPDMLDDSGLKIGVEITNEPPTALLKSPSIPVDSK